MGNMGGPQVQPLLLVQSNVEATHANGTDATDVADAFNDVNASHAAGRDGI